MAQSAAESGARLGRRRTLAEVIFRTSPTPPVRPTAEAAQSWSTSLNVLLDSKYGKNLFIAFLRKEYSEEYLEFYDQVTKYRNSSSKRKMEKRAKRIMERYIVPDAPKELLNIDHVLRSELIKSTADLAELNNHAFDSLQNKVFAILEAGSYRRFLSWSVYTDLTDPGSPAEHDN